MEREKLIPYYFENSPFETKWLDAVKKIKVFDTLEIPIEYLDTIKPKSMILDAGCGEGRISRLLRSEKDALVHGIDINEDAIAKAQIHNLRQEQTNTTSMMPIYKRMNCRGTTFPDNQFDYVVLVGILGLLEPEGVGEALTEMFRVLKPEETLMVTDYSRDSRRKIQYEEGQLVTGKYGTIPVYDPEDGRLLFYATHFDTEKVIQAFLNVGIVKSSIRTVMRETTSVALDGTARKARLQFTAWGRKPLEAGIPGWKKIE